MKDLKKNFLTTFLIGAVLLTGIVILVNMIFDNVNLGRFDLTADQVYKLSPSVSKILEELDAPIEITYYVSSSEKMPTQWKNLERDVIDKLNELKLVSKGKLSYTVFDPSAEEEREAYEETRAEEDANEPLGQQKPQITRKKIAERLFEKGVIPFGVQSTERDEFAVKRVYSSIVLSYLDRKEDVIQEVRPETFGNLEYDILSRIYKLIQNRRPKIAFYPSQPEMTPEMRQYHRQGPPPDQYAFAAQMLRESGYDVTRTNIKEDDPIPDDIQTMIVMVDQPLNERQLFELDKSFHSGVRLIMGAQQNSYQISPSREPGKYDLRGMPSRLNINQLSQTYGISFDENMFMDRNSAYIQIPVYQTRNMGAFQVREQRMEPVTKPVIIRVDAQSINTRLSISNKITQIFYMYGGRLVLNQDNFDENKIRVQNLFTSSDYSWIRQGYGYAPVSDAPPSPDNVLKNQPLAVLAEGTFPSKYADTDPPAWPTSDTGQDDGLDLAAAAKFSGDATETKLIAIGGTNIFKDDILKSVVSHRALLQNCVDALTLGDDLINIRSKNISARRIKNISSVGKAASKGFVVWFSPIVFVAIGIYLSVKRKLK